jgi:hypothetical protein
MFTLADGRVMFLDPEVGGKIESFGHQRPRELHHHQKVG